MSKKAKTTLDDIGRMLRRFGLVRAGNIKHRKSFEDGREVDLFTIEVEPKKKRKRK